MEIPIDLAGDLIVLLDWLNHEHPSQEPERLQLITRLEQLKRAFHCQMAVKKR